MTIKSRLLGGFAAAAGLLPHFFGEAGRRGFRLLICDVKATNFCAISMLRHCGRFASEEDDGSILEQNCGYFHAYSDDASLPHR